MRRYGCPRWAKSALKMQVAAIALVVATGVGLFVAMLSTYRSLRVSEDGRRRHAAFRGS
jgi:hypothetical protein